ncbi:MAG: peptide ABC transporter substrate-binding protein [Vulcanimicrobiaceae bacterium]
MAVAVTACTKTQTAGDTGGRHSWTTPNVLRVALYLAPNSLNPIYTTNSGEVGLAAMAFDPLVTVDDKGNDIPVLAAEVPTVQNGDITKDNKTITYKLRHNVKWHDGVAFTSDDVKFSWQAVMNPANNVQTRRGYDLVSSVDTPDKYTVVFHMKQVFPPAVETLFSSSDQPYSIIPKHLLAKYPDLNKVPFNSEPIGTGPFKFAKWLRGDRIEYVANPDYFLGKPKLDQIIWKIIPDSNTQTAQLRSHEIDWIPEINGQQYRDLRNHEADGIVVARANSPSYEGLALNMERPPLTDPLVRQALAYGIDKKRIMDETQFGAADPATEDIPSYSWAYDPSVPKYDYNPEKAKQLLDRAGWKAGPDGIRVKNGQPLSLQFIIAQGSSSAQAIGTLVQAQLRPIGVDAAIKSYSFTMLYATKAMGGILNGGKYDIAVYAWVSGSDPDDSASFMCAYKPPAGNNIFAYCNKDFDAAERAALASFERPVRKAAYAKTQTLMAQDIPQIYLFYRKQLNAINPDFKGFASNGIIYSWNAYQWSI